MSQFKHVETITEPEQLASGKMVLLMVSYNGELIPYYCRGTEIGPAVQELLAHYRSLPPLRRAVEPAVLSFTGPSKHSMPVKVAEAA